MPIDADKLGLSKDPSLGHVWACLACFLKGIWTVTSVHSEWCVGEDKHNIHTGIPSKNVDPNLSPEGNGENIYGFGKGTETSNWLCEPCFDKGRIQKNGPQNVICTYPSCGSPINPINGVGGYLFFVCVKASKQKLAKGLSVVQIADKCFLCGGDGHEFGYRSNIPEDIDLPYCTTPGAWFKLGANKRGWLCFACGYKNRAGVAQCPKLTNKKVCGAFRDDRYLYRKWP